MDFPKALVNPQATYCEIKFFPQPKWYIIRKCVFLIKDGLQIRKGENK